MVAEPRPIRIVNLSVKNLGPIPEFQATLGDLNLFYGPNESGKTFLVEFIIQSIFSKTTHWAPLRQLSAQGKVVVEGLERSPVEFHLNQRGGPKLDDLLEKTVVSLTVPLARILVVRAADVSIGDNGLSKDAIKEVFLRRRFFENIRGRIQRVVQAATITEEGLIDIKRQGEGKQRFEYMERLQHLNECIERVQRGLQSAELMELQIKRESISLQIEQQERARRYEAYRISRQIHELKGRLSEMPSLEEIGRLKERVGLYFKNLKRLKDLQRQIVTLQPFLKKREELEAAIQRLIMAKRHLAYRVSREITGLEEQLRRFPESDLRDLDLTIRQYQAERGKYENLKRERERIEDELSNLRWVPEAASRYQQLQNNPPIYRPNVPVLILAALSFLGGIGGFLMDKGILGAALLLLSGLGLGYYLWRLKRALDDYPRARELQVLEERFKEALGRDTVVSADIEELKRQITEKEAILKGMDLEALRVSLEVKANSVKMLFERLKAEARPEEEWLQVLQGLYDKRARLLSEIQSRKEFLSSLQVKPTEYVSDPPGVDFDEDNLQRLQQEMEEVKEKVSRYDHLYQEWQRLKQEIDEEGQELSEIITRLVDKKLGEEEWGPALRRLEGRVKALEDEVNRLEGLLKGLEISPEEYITQEPEVKYNKRVLNDLKEQERKIQDLISEKEKALEVLKAQAIQLSGADYSSDWPALIEALYEKREEVLKELRMVNARIVAGILVSQHLKQMQEEEDRQIEALLNSREFRDHLWSITRRYHGIQLIRDDFEIKDDFGAFSFSDLSTGAREQVLLALRLGMASRLSGHDRMFIILDDAFQHVDWQKRPHLVKALVDMANDGWQVIYLTMDDHIRDLFHRQARSLGDRYRFFDIKAVAEGQRRLF